MLTTRDVLVATDAISEVFKIGLSDVVVTTEFANSANVAELAASILRRQGEFVFKLTGYLLRGITCLYCRKSALVLENCEEIMARISLRFEEQRKKASDKRSKAKQQNHENIKNIETIIDDEREMERGLNLTVQDGFLESGNRFNDDSVQELPTRALVGNDFGGGQFELELESSDVMPPQDWNDENYEVSVPMAGNDEFVNLSKRPERVCQIDATPVIPMAQLSAMLDDASATLCRRPICHHDHVQLSASLPINSMLETQYDAARELCLKELQTQQDPYNFQPELAPEAAEQEDEGFHQDNIPELPDDVSEPDEQDTLDEVRNLMRRSLERHINQILTDVIHTRDRRELALSFMAAIRLHNQKLITLSQSDFASPILVECGQNF